MFASKLIIHLSLATGLLLAVSGGLMASVQHWVMQQPDEDRPSLVLPPSTVPSGIRSMVSTHPVPTSENHLLDTAVKETFKTVAVQSLKPVFEKASVKMPAPELNGHKPALAKLPTVVKRATNSHSTVFSYPVVVIYENEMVIEFPKKLATTRNIKKALSRVLLSSKPISDFDLLSNDKLNLKQRPYFYRRILDDQNQAIRYPKQAYDYAEYLMENASEVLQDEEGSFVALHIPMVDYGLSGPAKNYQAWVEDYADEFNVSPSLVYAVMETESAFNPKAVSRSNAIGLMQVKPEAAGRDVYHHIDARPGQPSLEDLFNSEKNIRMGTAYLSLLKHDYFSEIESDKIKKMLTISSYNGGLTTVLGLFGKTPAAAVKKLNRMNPKQVYRKLRYGHHSGETRQYLDKVLKAETKYRELLNEV